MSDFYYRKLNVYQLSLQLVVGVYELANKFPQNEKYALGNQIQRAVVSVPSNIAEGMGRFSVKERMHHLEMSLGSLMEVMCQLEIAKELHYITSEELQLQDQNITEIAKMLTGLRKSLENKILKE